MIQICFSCLQALFGINERFNITEWKEMKWQRCEKKLDFCFFSRYEKNVSFWYFFLVNDLKSWVKSWKHLCKRTTFPLSIQFLFEALSIIIADFYKVYMFESQKKLTICSTILLTAIIDKTSEKMKNNTPENILILLKK